MDDIDVSPIDASPILDAVRPQDVMDLSKIVGRQGSAPVYPDMTPVGTLAMPEKTPIVNEIATVRRNIFIPPRYDGILEPQDETLRSRGGGWNYKIYEQAEADPKIYSTLQKRKSALKAFPVEFVAASDSAIDVAAAELMKRAKEALNFPKFTHDLLDAINKGFSVCELMWSLVDGPTGKEWLATDALKRDQRRFKFDLFNQLRLIDYYNMITGEVLPARKFVVHSFQPEDGDPYGRGLGLMLWWRAMFKRQNLESWLVYNDKYASPTPFGTYPADASQEERDALFAALMSFSTSSGVAAAVGNDIKLIESGRAAGADTFRIMRDAENEDIDMIVLGATATASSGGLQGGSGADVDQEDRLELAQSDANDLAAALTRSWVAWTVEFNLPGAKPPRLKWLIDAEEDLSERAARDAKILSMGFEPSQDYIDNVYGEGWTKKAELAPVITDEANFAQRLLRALILPAPRPSDTTRPTLRERLFSFAQKPKPGAAPTDRIGGALTDQLATLADPVIDGWVDEVRKAVAASTTLDEIQDRLIDLYPHLAGTHFAQAIAAAIPVADLAGRVDVKHGG